MCAFLQEVTKYKDEFYRFVYRSLWDHSQVEDVFADAILTGLENFDRFKPGSNFRAWMFRILANKCFVANRQTMRLKQLCDETEEISLASDPQRDEPFSQRSHPEEVLELCSEEVYNAFQKISPIQRMCILLKDVEDFSYKEVSEILGIPEATVMTNIARGRKKLRELLAPIVKHRPKLEANTDTKFPTQNRTTDSSYQISDRIEIEKALA